LSNVFSRRLAGHVEKGRDSGIAATTENIIGNHYPLWAYEHLYTRGASSEAALDFVAFVT
jgi:hypothetical protein